MNVRETAEILGYLAAAWPKYELAEETVAVWVDQFANVDFEVAQSAAKAVVASDEWFPSVARFRELVGVQMRQRPKAAGCGACDRGFVLGKAESVGVCPVCHPHRLAPAGSRPMRELGSGEWESGIQSARERLSLPKGNNL